MELKESKKPETYGWNFEGMGKFEVQLWNGRIEMLRMNSTLDYTSNQLIATAGSEEFLRNIYTALGELLEYLNLLPQKAWKEILPIVKIEI